MATFSRHTFSGAAVACLLAASAGLGWVQAATAAAEATSAALVATESCPPSWPALHPGAPAGFFDGNVSTLVGGSLRVAGAATGAEGTVVVLGDATFARDVPGAYAVGVTALGSQVSPYAGSDMLVVGGNLSTGAGTHVDVGQQLGGDVVVGGAVADGTDLDAHGGRVDAATADATTPYLDLLGQLSAKSAANASLPATGAVEVTPQAITLTGDGVSNPQVFTLDATALDVPPDGSADTGRTLQLLGVPQDASVIVNLTGPAVDLDVDAVLNADGLPVDPLTDPAFGALATHLLWNAPTAATVAVGGLGQLPGSLLVPTVPSLTTLDGAGVNGRVLVAGDLVHTGAGELHAYPFLADPQLTCGPDLVHLTTLTLDIEVVDPDKVVDKDRFYEGRFECTLGGVDVTPADDAWKFRAGAGPRVVSDQIPAGAACTVTERLDSPPAPFRAWSAPAVAPDVVVVEKRREHGFTITNRVKQLPPAPSPTQTPEPSPAQTPTQEPTETVEQPVVSTPSSSPSPAAPTPSSVGLEPTGRPTPTSSPTAQPAPEPAASATPTSGAEEPEAGGPRDNGPAGPLTTTAPFTLRGAFVWAPVIMLSLLTLLLRTRRRPKRQH